MFSCSYQSYEDQPGHFKFLKIIIQSQYLTNCTTVCYNDLYIGFPKRNRTPEYTYFGKGGCINIIQYLQYFHGFYGDDNVSFSFQDGGRRGQFN